MVDEVSLKMAICRHFPKDWITLAASEEIKVLSTTSYIAVQGRNSWCANLYGRTEMSLEQSDMRYK